MRIQNKHLNMCDRILKVIFWGGFLELVLQFNSMQVVPAFVNNGL